MSPSEEFRRNSDNFCYRHPDRQSFVLCQRCMRTVCSECRTPAAVGVICPECMAQQHAAQTPAQKKAERRWASRSATVVASGRPRVTLTIVAVTGLIYIIGLIPGVGRIVSNLLAFNSYYLLPQAGVVQPWRLFTVALVHDGFFHVALNMAALWFIGRSLEPMLGRGRFLALYLLGALGGSVAVTLLAPGVWTVGASGAIFALFGALLVIGRHIGADIRVIGILIAINFAWPFVLAAINAIGSGDFVASLTAVGISWQAHLGGLVTGALVGLIYARTRLVSQRGVQIGLMVGLSVLLVALLAVPALTFP
ncbi:rhomboid family intramembrane serine protease [Microbacterium enclense]|uniref:Membrane associated serine protease, rhomboid family n=1 Tax=Microbacterium enclense TaxID=993073 RepID=A0A1G6JBI7_9MICO|nr:rhomboid family intramembrane serine protease [Microbacterium enclense]KSU54801.1 rhomboid family intramembrane serine protease [Microbacterium enclense]MCM3613833.1 rhomboid family intramembrane serine protease [Microbacterium enclense]SDC16111.1 Membrane associated serine protease, rhomboid family [Microbacterium enclense]